MSKGFTSNEALKKAYQAIDYSVMKQSTVLSYMIFSCIWEFYFVLYSHYIFYKKRAKQSNPADAAIIIIKNANISSDIGIFILNENYYPLVKTRWFPLTN
jgi:hypothetical protein